MSFISTEESDKVVTAANQGSAVGGPVCDAETLRRAGRLLVPPFRLGIDAAGEAREIQCDEILRLLPGKRLVCFGTWRPFESIVAKVYLDPSRARRHFQREIRGIEALQAAGIPTPAVLFQGVLADGRTPLLLTQRVTEARSLGQALASVDKQRAAPLLGLVVECLAQMHAAGLSQQDVHPGNFLLTSEGVLVIDGTDIRRHGPGPLSRSASIANLGLFLAQVFPTCVDLMPALAGRYLRCRGWSPSPALTRRIDKTVHRWSDWREKKFLQKCLRSCTAFVARKSWRRFTICDRECQGPAMDRLLKAPDTAMAAGIVLKAGNSTTVVKIDVDGRTLVIKRYNLKSIFHAIRRMPRPTRAHTSWRNANRLRFMGIATPRPLALVEERWGPLRRRAFFVSDFIAGESILEVVARSRENPAQLAACADHLGRLLAQLRLVRVSHGDMKASNLIVADGRLHLLDLDGMRKHRGIGGFRKAFRKDLRRLLANWRHDDSFRPLLMKRVREIDPHG